MGDAKPDMCPMCEGYLDPMVDHPQVQALNQRIAELERDLVTARRALDESIEAGKRYADERDEARAVVQSAYDLINDFRAGPKRDAMKVLVKEVDGVIADLGSWCRDFEEADARAEKAEAALAAAQCGPECGSALEMGALVQENTRLREALEAFMQHGCGCAWNERGEKCEQCEQARAALTGTAPAPRPEPKSIACRHGVSWAHACEQCCPHHNPNNPPEPDCERCSAAFSAPSVREEET